MRNIFRYNVELFTIIFRKAANPNYSKKNLKQYMTLSFSWKEHLKRRWGRKQKKKISKKFAD